MMRAQGIQLKKAGRRFPWYDGYWLEHFVNAKAFIAERHPHRMATFLEALAPLRTPMSFEARLFRSAIDDRMLARVREAVRSLQPNHLELHEIKSFGRWVVHDHDILTELQEEMTAFAEQAVGEPLEPSYNFLSLYTRMGRCPVHMDAPWAKWTLDICFDQSEPWPIHLGRVQPWPDDERFPDEGWEDAVIRDPRNAFSTSVMEPGDAIVFSGSSQWHYRDPLLAADAKSHCHLLFFHFIPRGMRGWIDPAGWEERFALPGLSEALGHPKPGAVSRR